MTVRVGVSVTMILVALLAGTAWLFMAGTVLVRDADHSLGAVELHGGAGEVIASKWPGGVHFSTAAMEGEATVICKNGRHVSLGYITAGLHIWRTLRAQDCRPGAPAVSNS